MLRRLVGKIRFTVFVVTGGALYLDGEADINAALQFYLTHGPCDHCWSWPCWCGNKPRLENDPD